jgi:hypothetical protein
MTYRWRARNYKTGAEETGEHVVFAKAKAEAKEAKSRLGFRETTVTVTSPKGRSYVARPAARGSGLVWEKEEA